MQQQLAYMGHQEMAEQIPQQPIGSVVPQYLSRGHDMHQDEERKEYFEMYMLSRV